MTTLNGFPITPGLLNLSKIIQDMKEDCKEETATDYQISSLTISGYKTLQDLEELFFSYQTYAEDALTICAKRDTLQLAIDLNMRSLFGRLLIANMQMYIRHFEKWDNILACLECCNGHAYSLLQDLWKLNNIPCNKLCMSNIQKFVEMEGDNDLALLEIMSDMSFKYIVASKNFVPKEILSSDIFNYQSSFPFEFCILNYATLSHLHDNEDEDVDGLYERFYDYVMDNIPCDFTMYVERFYILINDCLIVVRRDGNSETIMYYISASLDINTYKSVYFNQRRQISVL